MDGELDTLIQEKIDGDTEFQESIVDLSDEDKETALEAKRIEVLKVESAAIFAKSKKNEELANNYKTRAEKAEKGAKEVKPEPKVDDTLNIKDNYALLEAKVPLDDVDEVVRAAKVLGKTVAEALKDPIVVSVLKQREEYRTTSNAQNTRPVRPSVKAISGDEIMAKASKGEIPEAGTKEAEELYWARRGGRPK